MKEHSIPIIEIEETDPKRRGRAYGEAVRKRIETILDVYRELFQRTTGETWEEIIVRGQQFVGKAKVFAPDLIVEIQGIAEGANRSFEDIFLLNSRSEIIFNPQTLAQECTTLAALPEVTQQGDTLLAQNWDWYREVENCQVILKIGEREDKPAMVTFTEAGQLAKIGMNGAGIGLVVNNLISDQPRVGVPWIFITRRILESSHFAKALGYVLNTQRAHSINFLIGYDGGEALDLETSPVEEHMMWPANGILAHTNHYLQPGTQFKDLKPLRDPYLSTYLRYQRTLNGLVSMKDHIDVPGIKSILRDHMDEPFSVCAHRNPAVDPLQQIVTCLSIVMNLSRRQIHYTLGNPCRGTYQKIEVN